MSFDGAAVRVRTIAPVEAGAELTCTYVNLVATTSERQQRLRCGYGFECECVRCVQFGALDAAMEDLPLDDAAVEDLPHDLPLDEQLKSTSLKSKSSAAALAAARQSAVAHALELLHRAELFEMGEEEEEAADEEVLDALAELDAASGRVVPSAAQRAAGCSLALAYEAVQTLRDAHCDARSGARYAAERALCTQALAVGGYDEMARTASSHALAHVSAVLEHVPHLPTLALATYAHAQLEAETGDAANAEGTARRALVSLRLSHGDEHPLTMEVAAWADDLRVQRELERGAP
jgi:hypothetical protein